MGSVAEGALAHQPAIAPFGLRELEANPQPTNQIFAEQAHPESLWFSDLKGKLNVLFNLHPGWDGYKGRPLTLESALMAIHLTSRLVGRVYVPPWVFPLPDGGLQLEWHAGPQSIEIEIDSQGDAHALVVRDADEIAMNDDLTLDDPIALRQVRDAVQDLAVGLLGSW
ncbi:MAG: hypothetical protein WB116_10325 [Candidatus Dormiibacterota bacterium]